ncbi:putative type II secretion system integral membrane subunit [Rhodococcus sp. AW25M09]|uniref:type II secretion system F family protein n=1 Tax=Rhodococcus sp. AW25M09 TaxID=1268303 RepID=UPI0002AC362D|nr:type II secretion system F family protein [Rhodococcus sp. AW25M09]CCQ14709.1 putative type II secretion system integral membrane subunit [Rhodococcus sp. AW25M09]
MTWATVLCLATALIAVPTGGGGLRRLARDDGPDADTTSTASPDPLAVATTFDLLAACLLSGLPVATAAAAAAPSAPTSFAVALRKAADLLELGADAETAWDAVAHDPETEALARMARRSARAGSSMASAMSELAATQRTRAEDASAAAAERAGVLISGPLGLCFLPAFICLGIIPVVIGLAGNVLGGGVL